MCEAISARNLFWLYLSGVITPKASTHTDKTIIVPEIHSHSALKSNSAMPSSRGIKITSDTHARKVRTMSMSMNTKRNRWSHSTTHWSTTVTPHKLKSKVRSQSCTIKAQTQSSVDQHTLHPAMCTNPPFAIPWPVIQYLKYSILQLVARRSLRLRRRLKRLLVA